MSRFRRAAVLAAALLALSPALPAMQEKASSVVTSLTIFAGTPSGLWRSTDWGGAWQKAEGRADGELLAGIGAVHCVLPGGPQVWMGTDTGLLVSEDFGLGWKRTDLKMPVFAVVPSRYPGADPTVFVGTAEGLLKSVDGGRTFQPTMVRGFAVTRIEWPGPALVLATANGVLVSPDGGLTVQSGVGLPEGPVHALALSSFFAADPVLFAGMDQGAFRSADGGRTWVPAGLAGHPVRDLVWLGPMLYAATDRGLFRSEDAGEKWSPLGEGLKDRQPRRLLFPLAPASGAEAFVATDRGVLRTGDGGERWLPTGTLEEPVLVVATFPAPIPTLRKK
jgi:ligand-binding sensor domain-containing protein